MNGETEAGFEYSGVDNLESMLEATNYNAWLARTVAGQLHGNRVLDFGAGQGLFASLLRERGVDVVCLEPDGGLRKGLERSGFAVCEALSAVEPGAFDSIYSLNVLEHIEDDAAALRQLSAALSPGGRLVLYVPAFMLLYGEMDRLVGHYRRYRLAGLVRQVRDAGFSVRHARYVDSLGFFAALLYRYVGDRSGRVGARSVRLYDRIVFPLSRVLDTLTHRFFGKNLLIVATKGSGS